MAEPISPITLEDSELQKYAFRPQSDMTGLEAALLAQLFIKMLLNRSGTLPDWMTYVSEHALERHFVFVGPPSDNVVDVQVHGKLTRTLTNDAGDVLVLTEDMPIPDGWRLVEFKEPGL